MLLSGASFLSPIFFLLSPFWSSPSLSCGEAGAWQVLAVWLLGLPLNVLCNVIATAIRSVNIYHLLHNPHNSAWHADGWWRNLWVYQQIRGESPWAGTSDYTVKTLHSKWLQSIILSLSLFLTHSLYLSLGTSLILNEARLCFSFISTVSFLSDFGWLLFNVLYC